MKAEIGGKYIHYKGSEYQVVAIAKQEWSPDSGEFVVYRATHGLDDHEHNASWIRPRAEFEEEIVHHGTTVHRFTRVDL